MKCISTFGIEWQFNLVANTLISNLRQFGLYFHGYVGQTRRQNRQVALPFFGCWIECERIAQIAQWLIQMTAKFSAGYSHGLPTS